MRIINFKIHNFRNISSADADFGPINVISGKNASGKSNYLLALSKSLRPDRDYSDIFFDNVVTFGRGKNLASFAITIGEIMVSYLQRDTLNSKLVYMRPESLRFENVIGKRSSVPIKQRLYYSGDYLVERNPQKIEQIDFEVVRKSKEMEKWSDKLVFEYTPAKYLETHAVSKVIHSQLDTSGKDPQFMSMYRDLVENLYSWVEPGQFSSTKIHKFVVEKYDSEITEQVLMRLKDKKDGGFSPVLYERSKFVLLLADIQRSGGIYKLAQDLKLYTQGAVTGLEINEEGGIGNKGEIKATCPGAPKDIFYLSAGTAVLVYFIVLKNWLYLSRRDRSYATPDVMVFDEIDGVIHPMLIPFFVEVLRSISKRTQLFLSTHSPRFIDEFKKSELYWLKDISTEKSVKVSSNIFSYKEIIGKLKDDATRKYFAGRTNSELFVEGLLDSVFPMFQQ